MTSEWASRLGAPPRIMRDWVGMSSRLRRQSAVVTAAGLALVGLAAAPSSAVNADQGSTVVSALPATFTPHVMNGSVNAITQVGNEIVAAGTFTKVSPAGTYSNPADDLTRNGIFAFNATTGVIDPSFNPNLTGPANSLSHAGTSIYVGGKFSAVGGNTAYKRLVKLTAAGVPVAAFKAVPSAAVSEVLVS